MKTGIARLKRWWYDKYKRPAFTDPHFLQATQGELMQEMIEDAMLQREDMMDDLAKEGGETATALTSSIRAIDKFLGDHTAEVSDPLVDKWEAAFERGEIPDLDEEL